MSYFVYSQCIGKNDEYVHRVLVLISTKGTEKSSALDTIIINLIKT